MSGLSERKFEVFFSFHYVLLFSKLRLESRTVYEVHTCSSASHIYRLYKDSRSQRWVLSVV